MWAWRKDRRTSSTEWTVQTVHGHGQRSSGFDNRCGPAVLTTVPRLLNDKWQYFQCMVLGKLDVYTQKTEAGPLPNSTYKSQPSLAWCGSVDWEPKGHRFDSQSGHMPGLRARSPVGGVWEATTHRCFSPSLSPSLPFSLK